MITLSTIVRPHAKLFTDLDKMEIGDTFILTVLDRTFTYQVDQIKVVRPDESNDIQIIPGEDHCTLLTCTPYGINSHRLLVRGTRIENATPPLHVTSNAYKIDCLQTGNLSNHHQQHRVLAHIPVVGGEHVLAALIKDGVQRVT